MATRVQRKANVTVFTQTVLTVITKILSQLLLLQMDVTGRNKDYPTCYNRGDGAAVPQYNQGRAPYLCSEHFLRCALTSEPRRAACLCLSPCDDSPSLVHLAKRAGAHRRAVTQASRAHSHASVAASRALPLATEALGRPQTSFSILSPPAV